MTIGESIEDRKTRLEALLGVSLSAQDVVIADVGRDARYQRPVDPENVLRKVRLIQVDKETFARVGRASA